MEVENELTSQTNLQQKWDRGGGNREGKPRRTSFNGYLLGLQSLTLSDARKLTIMI